MNSQRDQNKGNACLQVTQRAFGQQPRSLQDIYLLSMKAMKCCCHCWRKIGNISSALVFSILRSCAILSARGLSSAQGIVIRVYVNVIV